MRAFLAWSLILGVLAGLGSRGSAVPLCQTVEHCCPSDHGGTQGEDEGPHHSESSGGHHEPHHHHGAGCHGAPLASEDPAATRAPLRQPCIHTLIAGFRFVPDAPVHMLEKPPRR